MECIPNDEILETYPDTLEVVRRGNGLDRASVNAAIDELDLWIKEQDHFLKKDYSRHYLESILMGAKGKVERVKSRLETSFMMRKKCAYLYGNYNLKTDFKELDGVFHLAVLPKLTKDHSRIFLMKVIGNKFYSTFCSQSCRIIIMFLEYLRANDYSGGMHIVIDYRDVSLMSLLPKIKFMEIKNSAPLFMSTYVDRLKGIHFITPSIFVNVFLVVIKQIVSSKLGSRIHWYKDLDEFNKALDNKEVMPAEYGGEERSLECLHDEWKQVLSTPEFRENLAEINKSGVDLARKKTPYLSK